MATFSAEGMITALDPGEVFVFGSNLAGRHGMGAARQALKWGAVYGFGRGMYGQTYALPTKDDNLNVLSPEGIRAELNRLNGFVRKYPHLVFLLSAVGTGLAGYQEPVVRQWVEAIDYPANLFPWWVWPHNGRIAFGIPRLLPESPSGTP